MCVRVQSPQEQNDQPIFHFSRQEKILTQNEHSYYTSSIYEKKDMVFRTIVGLDHILFFRRDAVGRLHHDFEDLSRSFTDTRQKTKNRSSVRGVLPLC